jgi:preprotein translocase subunit SecE
MAVKKPEKKENKVMQVLKTEYPMEGIILGFLGILVLVLGIYIYISEYIYISQTEWWIFNTQLKRDIFAILVMIIGLGAIIMSLAPFVLPGVKEMKRVSWPKRDTMINHSMRVLGFIIFLGLVFVLYDAIFRRLFSWIIGN